MTPQQIDDLTKDIRQALSEKRIGLDARLEIAFAWGDLGYNVYMDGEAAQEIAQKHSLKPFADPDCLPCYFWDSNE
jgi:hypothetical protein